jgi:hypothetical protein
VCPPDTAQTDTSPHIPPVPPPSRTKNELFSDFLAAFRPDPSQLSGKYADVAYDMFSAKLAAGADGAAIVAGAKEWRRHNPRDITYPFNWLRDETWKSHQPGPSEWEKIAAQDAEYERLQELKRADYEILDHLQGVIHEAHASGERARQEWLEYVEPRLRPLCAKYHRVELRKLFDELKQRSCEAMAA